MMPDLTSTLQEMLQCLDRLERAYLSAIEAAMAGDGRTGEFVYRKSPALRASWLDEDTASNSWRWVA